MRFTKTADGLIATNFKTTLSVCVCEGVKAVYLSVFRGKGVKEVIASVCK